MNYVSKSFTIAPINKTQAKVEIVCNNQNMSKVFDKSYIMMLFSNHDTVVTYSKSMIANEILRDNNIEPIFYWCA